MIDYYFCDKRGIVPDAASKNDAIWFRENPQSTCRVRLLLEGESHLSDACTSANPGTRGYAIVINHGRLRDKRRKAGVVAYPTVVSPYVDAERKDVLVANAKRLVAWFRQSAKTPLPAEGTAVVGSKRIGDDRGGHE
jgi:hypothetical protein